MNHKKFGWPTFEALPNSLKVLYTMLLTTLGVGYIFALIQIFETHAGLDGKPGLSVQDIQIAYRGDRSGTRLESALRGPMSGMASAEEAGRIIDWIHAGGLMSKTYKEEVEPILKARCQGCHNGSNPGLPNLMTFEGVEAVSQTDTGVSVSTLVRVSHIHLFGITFIFGFLGLIFSHSYIRMPYVKSTLIAIPFASILFDIASWWLTKVAGPFGYFVIFSGGLMGLSFAMQWIISFYQLWFFRCPSDEVCEVRF